MYPVLVRIGDFQLRSYGVLVLASFLLALWLSEREARRKGLDPALIRDFAFYALLGGIVGARLYFVAVSQPAYYLRNPLEILAIWHGGLGILGALAGGLLAALWYCRRKGLPFWRLADTLAPGVALGQASGILACLANGDSYGKPTDLAWAITYRNPQSMAPLNIPLHPIEIYEIGAYLLVFLLVWRTRERFRADGLVFMVYLAGYGAARFSVEFFRGNPALLTPGLPAAQVFGVLLIVLAVVGFYLLRRSQSRTS